MTAPQDPNSKDPTSQNPPPNPIEPGQFVVAGQEDGVFKQPPSPSPQQTEPAPTTLPTPQEPSPAQGFSLPPHPPQKQPASITEPPVSPLLSQTTVPPQATSAAEPQPDPTPFVQPPSGSTTDPVTTPEPSMIKKLRLIAVVAIFVVLILLAVAILWFFVLGKRSQEPNKTENEIAAQIEEPSPPPKRTSGGFAELPPATESASEATPQGQ